MNYEDRHICARGMSCPLYKREFESPFKEESMNKHIESQRMVERLQAGDRVDVRSGAGQVTLVALGRIQPASEGSYAGRTVLHTTGDAFLPFATHTLYYKDDIGHEGWNMYGGESFQNLTQAVEGFKKITGRDA